MGDAIRSLLFLIFWLLVAAILLSAFSGDVRDVFEDYIPGFDLLDPVIDWLSDFLEDLWDAVIG